PPSPTLFPYTTLFRSLVHDRHPHAATGRAVGFVAGRESGGAKQLEQAGAVERFGDGEPRLGGTGRRLGGVHAAAVVTHMDDDERSEEHTSELQSRENI